MKQPGRSFKFVAFGLYSGCISLSRIVNASLWFQTVPVVACSMTT